MNNPAGVERRITLRLLAYWEKIRGSRLMPHEDDIDPDDIADLWDNCFLVHVTDLKKPDYNYTYLGDAIALAYQGDLLADASEEIVSPHASKLSVCYDQIISTKKPVVDEGVFRNHHNDIVKYRQCLLPLGEGEEVQAIFGGMRYRIFPA